MKHAEVVARLRAGLAERTRISVALDAHRAAAVAVPLIDRGGAPHLVFTLRTASLRAHSGQVSFPGGTRDHGDESFAHTARREAFEELGLDPTQLDPLGALDDVPTPSGFVITPVVCELRGAPAYHPNPIEVAEVFEAPLDAFTDPSIVEDLGERVYQGITYHMRAYHVVGHRVWGATARIVEQLLAVLL